MKKILSILLCLVTLLSLLAGCGGSEGSDGTTAAHKHSYATEWSNDETNHWYEATCEHTSLKANLGEHVDEDLNGICDICAYESVCDITGTTTHTYAGEWSSDKDSHWHAATCAHLGAVADKADHVDEDNDGCCDVCLYTGGHEHTFAAEWSSDETKHWHVSSCGHDVIAEEAEHVDLTNDGECDVCGWFDASHTHTFADTWTSDVTYHWYGATCEHTGAFTGKEQHVDENDNGYCDTCDYLMCNHTDFDLDGICDICGGPLDPDHVHEYGDKVGYDVNGHWHIATCHPGASSDKEEHADKNRDGSCDVCPFQICGHSFENTWSSDETHHWHAIMCTCSIARPGYALHEDKDGDGGCDICLYGAPIESVYEIIVDNEPYQMNQTGMITYSPVDIYFPQPGRYVITPNNENVRVWLDDGTGDFSNSGSTWTLEVEEAGTQTLYFRYFSFSYKEGDKLRFAYSVVRMDDLVLETMQGKVDLPTNTIYTIKFIAHEVGVYKLITHGDGLVIGLTEDSMEYYKGQIELNVLEDGQEFTLYVEYRSATETSFIFDWILEAPFSLDVGEGNYSVNVGPTQVDYKINFTAPEDGYYLLKTHGAWLTFAQMGEIYDVPVRLETSEILTPYMTAGEVYTIYLQTVYNYPEATNCFDTLTITNAGEKMGTSGGTVTPGADGSRYHISAGTSKYYRFQVTGGELGILAADGTITWTSDVYDVYLTAGQTYTYMLRGDASVSVAIETMTFSTTLYNGENTITMEPNKLYDIVWMYKPLDEDGNPTGEPTDMNVNSYVSLNWVGNLTVYVNGEVYERGTSIELLYANVQILVKSNGAAEVEITVTMDKDAGNQIVGVTEAELVVNQYTAFAVNKDGAGTGAKATFTAELGGTYTLTVSEEIGMIYKVNPNGTKELVLDGAGTYTFTMDGGDSIEFFIATRDESVATVTAVLDHGE